jgi:hypothetical protein
MILLLILFFLTAGGRKDGCATGNHETKTGNLSCTRYIQILKKNNDKT